MWFWFLIPKQSASNNSKKKDQRRSSSNPPIGEPVQPETNIQQEPAPETNIQHQTTPETNLTNQSEPETNLTNQSEPKEDIPRQSIPEADIPQQSEPETETPLQSEPETNFTKQPHSKKRKPQKSQQKKAITTRAIPSTEILPILKPELLCIGFIGLLHNSCWLFVLIYYFVYWAIALSYVIKEERDNPTADHYYEYGRLKVTILIAIISLALLLTGMVLIVVVLRMDYYLRYTTDPIMGCYEIAKILQNYVMMNTLFLIYSVIVFFVVYILIIPPEYVYPFIGLMVVSICLRIVSADLVEGYLTLLARLAGIKTCRIFCCSPIKQARVQPTPVRQSQQV